MSHCEHGDHLCPDIEDLERPACQRSALADLHSTQLDEYGPRYDRIYMLVEPIRKVPRRYKSMSQKRYPKVSKPMYNYIVPFWCCPMIAMDSSFVAY